MRKSKEIFNDYLELKQKIQVYNNNILNRRIVKSSIYKRGYGIDGENTVIFSKDGNDDNMYRLILNGNKSIFLYENDYCYDNESYDDNVTFINEIPFSELDYTLDELIQKGKDIDKKLNEEIDKIVDRENKLKIVKTEYELKKKEYRTSFLTKENFELVNKDLIDNLKTYQETYPNIDEHTVFSYDDNSSIFIKTNKYSHLNIFIYRGNFHIGEHKEFGYLLRFIFRKLNLHSFKTEGYNDYLKEILQDFEKKCKEIKQS